MIDILRNENDTMFQKYLSNCVNVKCKTFYNKELILSFTPIKKQIAYISYGKATIIKTDINGNTTILKELKEHDIFSNLFLQDFEDEIYIISNSTVTEVIFIDYSPVLKDCTKNCPFHHQLVVDLFELLIKDNKQQNEKIELLSKRTVKEKILFFLKKRMNENHVFKVTTSYKAIAEYICVDRANFMRELVKLEKENLIKKEGKTIYIKF